MEVCLVEKSDLRQPVAFLTKYLESANLQLKIMSVSVKVAVPLRRNLAEVREEIRDSCAKLQ